jgi:hypothetical protein
LAYARRSRTCSWYIYWTATDAEHEALRMEGKHAARDLAHLTIQGPASENNSLGRELFTYPEVLEMLNRSDFAGIAGYTSLEKSIVVKALTEFVRDVEAEYGAP